MKRLMVFLASTTLVLSALAGSVAAAKPRSATPGGPLVYVYPCVDGRAYLRYQFHAYNQRIDYVEGQISYLRDVKTCTPPQAGRAETYVLSANLQSNQSAAVLVQLGYGRLNPQNVLTWVFTPYDNTGGRLPDDAAKYCCVGGGVLRGPIVGHHYRTRIWLFHGDTWYYEVYDYGDNLTWRWTTVAHYVDSYWGWWGFETYDSNSQYGGPSYEIDLFDEGAQYRDSQTTLYNTDLNIYSDGAALKPYMHDGARSVGPNLHAEMWAYTDYH